MNIKMDLASILYDTSNPQPHIMVFVGDYLHFYHSVVVKPVRETATLHYLFKIKYRWQ